MTTGIRQNKKQGRVLKQADRQKSMADGLQEMPYEKFERFGAENLTEAELLAIILRTGTKDISALELGRQILSKTGGLSGLYHISPEDLMTLKGIGRIKAVKVTCIAELSRRMARECAREGLKFNTPASVAAYYMEELRHEKREKVLLVLLDSKGLLLKEVLLSTGTVNSSLVSMREIFIEVLKAEAVGFLLLHNHPSGDPSPSGNDREVTELMKKSARLMDVELLDHIIIGDNRYYSFSESRLL